MPGFLKALCFVSFKSYASLTKLRLQHWMVRYCEGLSYVIYMKFVRIVHNGLVPLLSSCCSMSSLKWGGICVGGALHCWYGLDISCMLVTFTGTWVLYWPMPGKEDGSNAEGCIWFVCCWKGVKKTVWFHHCHNPRHNTLYLYINNKINKDTA